MHQNNLASIDNTITIHSVSYITKIVTKLLDEWT